MGMTPNVGPLRSMVASLQHTPSTVQLSSSHAKPGWPRATSIAPRAPQPEIDPAPRPGIAPMADRRFPSPEQAARPELQVLPGIPTARSPMRGSTYSDRDLNHDNLGRGNSPLAEPGLSVRIPLR